MFLDQEYLFGVTEHNNKDTQSSFQVQRVVVEMLAVVHSSAELIVCQVPLEKFVVYLQQQFQVVQFLQSMHFVLPTWTQVTAAGYFVHPP